MNAKGFTIVELIMVILFLSFWGAVLFVAAHFIAKFW